MTDVVVYLSQLSMLLFDPNTPETYVALYKGIIWFFSVVLFYQSLESIRELVSIFKGKASIDWWLPYHFMCFGGLWVTVSPLLWWNYSNVLWALWGMTLYCLFLIGICLWVLFNLLFQGGFNSPLWKIRFSKLRKWLHFI